MSKKHFSWLLALSLGAALVVLLVPGKTGKESSYERGPLMPGLAAIANDLDFIRLSAGGAGVIATFVRRDGRWRVVEASSYPADWNKLRKLIADLSKAEVIEEKTSRPELYSRLGVEDVTAESGSGVLIEFAESSKLPALIAGQPATGRDGQYVRLAGAEASVLIDLALNVPADPVQWLDRDIIDISADEVVEVSITHPEGEMISARRESADDADFNLRDIPTGREPASNWSVNSLGGGLADMRLDEIVSDTEIDWAGAIVLSLLTADGLRANAWLVQKEESPWMRIEVSAYQAMNDETGTPPPEPPDVTEELTTRVNRINERVSGWAYRIPQYKYDAVNKRMEDLLKTAEAP